ncbi:uncharacterized protein KZ484_020750 [Pholidichthys leucotaenia]
MCSVEQVREFVQQRLSAAAEDILGVFVKTLVQFEEEVRQRTLQDFSRRTATLKLHRIDLPQQPISSLDVVVAEHQSDTQERASHVVQKDPEPPQFAEEQKEECANREVQQLIVKEENDTYMVDEENHPCEPEPSKSQLLPPYVSPLDEGPVEDSRFFSCPTFSSTTTATTSGIRTKNQCPVCSKVYANIWEHLRAEHSVTDEIERPLLLAQQVGRYSSPVFCPVENPNSKMYIRTGRHLKTFHNMDGSDMEARIAMPNRTTITEELKGIQAFKLQSDSYRSEDPSCSYMYAIEGTLGSPRTSEKQSEQVLDFPQPSVCEKNITDLELQEIKRNFSNDQEDLKAQHIKEEQDELCINPEGEQPVLNQEASHFIVTYEDSQPQINGGYLLSHNAVHHDVSAANKMPYFCNTCGKRFKYASLLKMHISTHTGERPYSCKVCGKCFRRNDHLIVHTRTHTGEKPYPCNICGKRFRDASNLICHKRTHTGERRYFCEICGKTFAHRQNLTAHMTTHTGMKPYHCSMCEKRFISLAKLKVHLRTHTGEKAGGLFPQANQRVPRVADGGTPSLLSNHGEGSFE